MIVKSRVLVNGYLQASLVDIFTLFLLPLSHFPLLVFLLSPTFHLLRLFHKLVQLVNLLRTHFVQLLARQRILLPCAVGDVSEIVLPLRQKADYEERIVRRLVRFELIPDVPVTELSLKRGQQAVGSQNTSV